MGSTTLWRDSCFDLVCRDSTFHCLLEIIAVVLGSLLPYIAHSGGTIQQMLEQLPVSSLSGLGDSAKVCSAERLNGVNCQGARSSTESKGAKPGRSKRKSIEEWLLK